MQANATKNQNSEMAFQITKDSKPLEVIVAAKLASAAEAMQAVPSGFRLITVKEGVIAWNTSQAFRQTLCRDLGVWTGNIAIKIRGAHTIERDFSFKKVSDEEELYRLGLEKRALVIPGNGLVALCGLGGERGRLFVIGMIIPGDSLRIAYKMDTNSSAVVQLRK